MNNYNNEAYKRWGGCVAYSDYKEKTKNYTKEKWEKVNQGLMALFAQFAECKLREESFSSHRAQAVVVMLKEYITDNYYMCTDEILKGLAKMYVEDDRFKKNIDIFGEGTAQFACRAICVYCQNVK